jgi:epoxide hydrolase-like predicted phosphatase
MKIEHASSTIEAVLFDVGGVLSEEMIERKLLDLARVHGLPAERLLSLRPSLRLEADLGRISDRGFWREILRRAGAAASSISEEDLEIERYLAPVQGTLELARRLKQRYRVGILSNDSREMARARRRKLGLDAVFDRDTVIISAEVGLAKPDQKIFDLAVQRLGVDPARCLLVDDRQDNVQAARSCGLQAIQFSSAAQLEQELRRLGLSW